MRTSDGLRGVEGTLAKTLQVLRFRAEDPADFSLPQATPLVAPLSAGLRDRDRQIPPAQSAKLQIRATLAHRSVEKVLAQKKSGHANCARWFVSLNPVRPRSLQSAGAAQPFPPATKACAIPRFRPQYLYRR